MTLKGRYIRQDSVFEGSTSSVSLYKDTLLDRLVVLKQIYDIDESEYIHNEVRKIRNIESSHVVRIYDLVFDDTKLSGIIGEFLPGADIAEACRSDVRRFSQLMYQFCKGLDDIHAAGIVHRDIKPANAKLDDQNILRIFDFGISGAVNEDTFVARGTTLFKAPEYFGARPMKVGYPADVYALGVTVWCMLTKSFDYMPRSLLELPPQTESLVPSFKEVLPFDDGDLCEILDRTLSVNPEERPVARELLEAFEKRLLLGKHRAVFVMPKDYYVLEESGKGVKLTHGSNELGVFYDGTNFKVRSFRGYVYLNNVLVELGHVIPDAAVITLGSKSHPGGRRAFIPVHISHPEVL